MSLKRTALALAGVSLMVVVTGCCCGQQACCGYPGGCPNGACGVGGPMVVPQGYYPQGAALPDPATQTSAISSQPATTVASGPVTYQAGYATTAMLQPLSTY